MTAPDKYLDEWVVHNTRLSRRNREALALLVLKPGLTFQGITQDSVTEWLLRHAPEVLQAIGDPEKEAALAAEYNAESVQNRTKKE